MTTIMNNTEYIVNEVAFSLHEAPIVFDLMCDMHNQFEAQKYENIVPWWKRTKLYYFIMRPFKLDRYGLIYHHLNYRPIGFCDMVDNYFLHNTNSINNVINKTSAGRLSENKASLTERIYAVLASTSRQLHSVYWVMDSPIGRSKYWYGNYETIMGYDPIKRLEVVQYIKDKLVKQDKLEVLSKKDYLEII